MVEATRLLPQLVMKRDHLRDLPPISLAAGYTLRTSEEGDGAHWVRILNEAFGGARTAADFVATMVNDPAYRADRIFFVCDPDGVPCATASAYRHGDWGPQTGMLHYVATCPAHTGKRLGMAVSVAVLHQFAAEGCADAMLQTDDFRLPAVLTYLRLGFHPHIIHENQPARWRTVLAELNWPADDFA